MKKYIFFISILLSSYLYSSAQFDFGAKAGGNYNYLNSPSTSSAGFHAGIMSQFNYGDKTFIRAYLLYFLKSHSEILIPNGTTRYNLNYISIPILDGFRVSKKLSILLGPEFSYLVNANTTINGTKQNITSDYQHFNIAIDAGLSLNFSHQCGMELTYNLGLKNITDYSPDFSEKNRSFQLGFFYLLKHRH